MCPSVVKHSSSLTVFADMDGFRSTAGGAPNVRFFVVAVSAPSLVSMLESAITPNHKASRSRGRNGVDSG